MRLSDSSDRGPALIVIFWTFCLVALGVTSLRLLSRRIIKAFGWDDWTMVLTMLLFLGATIMITLLVSMGGFKHAASLTEVQMRDVRRWTLVARVLTALAQGLSKVSVALLVLRFAGRIVVWRRLFLYACIASTLLLSVLHGILIYVQCNPVRALWETVPRARCWEPTVINNFAVFLGSWNVLVDIALAIVPVSLVWSLQLNTRKKVGLSVVLGAGVLAAGCAALRTYYLSTLTKLTDLTWGSFPVVAWTGAEIFLLIVCGSIPALKPLCDSIFGLKQSTAACITDEKHLRRIRKTAAVVPNNTFDQDNSEACNESRSKEHDLVKGDSSDIDALYRLDTGPDQTPCSLMHR